MEKDDVQLIHKILSGDDEAFSSLVEKYQKGVHALAWREIGDFHFAEEITQDVFLQVYKKLSTLRNPKQFSGWLYVITKRLCINWATRNKLNMQSLEGTPIKEIDKSSYKHYVLKEQEAQATERRHAVVKKLLQKLPESERTVVTLYYLGEMPPKEISKFLGVSVNTINSRIRRARKRLQEKEEILINGILSSVQVSPNLTKNLMEQVATINLKPQPVGKPLLPWTALGTATVLVILGFGLGNQYLVHYQKPYSFHAQSEPTVEIVEVSVILDLDPKFSQQNQIGNIIPLSINNGKDKFGETKTVNLTGHEQERFFGLTLAEIKEKIPELEKEIRTDLTKAVKLYKELKTTDGMAAMSPEVAEWRDKTWKEVKMLFNGVADSRKILTYTSYLRAIGEEQNPTLPGGWIYKLMEPLPMRVTVGNSTEKPSKQDSSTIFEKNKLGEK